MPASIVALGVGPAAPLVYIANFVDADTVAGLLHRLERWALQSVARDILKGEGSWQRLCNCCRAVQDSASVVQVRRSLKGAERAFYVGLQHCASSWVCLVCGAKIVEHRRAEVERGIVALAELGGSAGFLTLTFAHGAEHNLVDLEGRHGLALHHFRDSRAWKSLKRAGLRGTIRGKEFTVGARNGWHPHTHTVLCFDTPGLPVGLEDTLWPAWSAALASVGLSARRAAYGKSVGLSVEATYGSVADYVVKTGCQPSKRPWGVEDDLVRGVSKSARSGDRWSPPDLLRQFRDTGEVSYFRWFREYAAATRGGSPVRWSPGLRALLLPGEAEKSDQEVADGVEQDAPILGDIPAAVWRVVLGADRRGELLEVANRGGWAAVVDYVNSIRGAA